MRPPLPLGASSCFSMSACGAERQVTVTIHEIGASRPDVRGGWYARIVSEISTDVALGVLGWRLPRVRDPAAGRRIAYGIHLALVDMANQRGAIDIAIGEGLAALNVGLRAMVLGYSNIGDYAREELGLNASTAAKMERLARRLRDLPLIRSAVRLGLLTTRKAEIISVVAKGNEAYWLVQAQTGTVRALKAQVRGPRDPEEEKWVNLRMHLPGRKRVVVDVALALAGMVLEKPTASNAERIEAWCQEHMGSREAPPDEKVDDLFFTPEDEGEELKAHLERLHRQWVDVPKGTPVKAPEESGEIDPSRIDQELKALIQKRKHWDQRFGQLAMLFKQYRGWELCSLASFSHYCEEILGMSERAVAQRVALERGLVRNPLLRQALNEQRLSYEKARLIARDAKPEEVPAWIEQAQDLTCIELRRQLEEKQEAQMCARDEFSVWMPAGIAELLKGTFRALRAEAKRWKWAEDCLVTLALQFIQAYRHLLKRTKTLQRQIRERDNYRCKVPGCSRAAVHAHHIIPRSQGGTDDEWNLVSLCASHHLNGIHGGRIRVTGRAPDKLVWEFGLRRSHASTAAA